MINIEEAIALIRRAKLLKNWTDDQIQLHISLAAKEGALAFTTNEEGRLKSIVFGRWHGKCYHCSAIVAHGELHLFMKYLKNTYPFCEQISMNRKGKYKIINL